MFKITVIIPTNDVRDFKKESFESLLSQTIGFDNLQILFVNSAHSKHIKDMANLSVKYDNVISITKDIEYYGKLCNIGLKYAVADYIMFLNPSDVLTEDACELLYEKILAEDVDIVCGATDNINPDLIIDNKLSLINGLNLNNAIFKKSFIGENDLKFSENTLNSDYLFLFNALLGTDKISILNKNFFESSEDSGLNVSEEMLKGYLDSYYEMYYIASKKDMRNEFIEKILCDKLSYFIDNFLLDYKYGIKSLVKILEQSKPLFEVCTSCKDDLSPLFGHIAQGNYEEAIPVLFNEDIPKLNEIRIAALCNSIVYNSFKYECELTQLNKSTPLEELENESFDLFFVASSFYKKITGKDIEEIKAILEYCDENGIPTIFWEDYNRKRKQKFEEIFSDFDYVFTSYKENVSRYSEHGNVHYLMHAAQPMLFNPMNQQHKLKDSVVFSGIWNNNDKKRRELISGFLNKLIANGYELKIFDESASDLENTKYPPIFYDYLNPRIYYSKMPKVYRENEIGLIINEDSDICRHEIFELMASNSLVFSNYSKEVYNLFKDNVNYLDCDNGFNERDTDRIKNENLHNVLENHTYTNRLKQILDTIGFKYIPDIKNITIFYELEDLTKLDEIYNHFYSISYPYKKMKIITEEANSFLPDSILKSQLDELQLNDNEYFCFANFNLDSNFVKYALLHFDYMTKEVGIKEDIDKKFVFGKTNDIENVIFKASSFKKAISDDDFEFDVYYFNNFETKVSVIIPVYNVENYLRNCLDSVVNQTLQDMEIICVNDGSYDSSPEILREYAEKDSRIKIIEQANKGLSGARNAGLEIAKGKYVYFLDSDDFIEENGLNEMYIQSELKNLDMLKCNLMTYNEDTDEYIELYQRVKPKFLKELGDIIFDCETIGSDVYTLSPNMQSSFFKMDVVKDFRFPENLIFEDNLFLIESLLNSKRVYYYDKFLAYKREREESITQSTGRNFPDIIEIRNLIADLAKKYDFYEDYKFTIYSRKYMFIKLLFLQTAEYYKKQFFEKIREDCINKKEEYESEGLFDILDKKSITIFNAGLNSKDYKEFEELIRNA